MKIPYNITNFIHKISHKKRKTQFCPNHIIYLKKMLPILIIHGKVIDIITRLVRYFPQVNSSSPFRMSFASQNTIIAVGLVIASANGHVDPRTGANSSLSFAACLCHCQDTHHGQNTHNDCTVLHFRFRLNRSATLSPTELFSQIVNNFIGNSTSKTISGNSGNSLLSNR